jgi:hypothetical protein
VTTKGRIRTESHQSFQRVLEAVARHPIRTASDRSPKSDKGP